MGGVLSWMMFDVNVTLWWLGAVPADESKMTELLMFWFVNSFWSMVSPVD